MQNLESFLLWAPWLIPLVGAAAVVLHRVAPTERRAAWLLCTIYVGSIAGLMVGRNLGNAHVEAAAVFGLGSALYCMAALFTLRAALPLVGLFSPRILYDVVVCLGVGVWLFAYLQMFGVNVTGLIATSAVLTAVVGFAMQDTLSNLAGGVALQMDGSIQVGDYVQVGSLTGRVVETRWRYTAVETRKWETVLIPNTQLMKDRFSILGKREGCARQWRRDVPFNVDFRYPPERVVAAVQEALRDADIANVAKEPPPMCLHVGFADSYARYEIRYWIIDLWPDDPTDSEVRIHVFAALQRAGIQLSIPAHAVFLTTETEERKASKISEEQARRVQALHKADLFRLLTEDDLDELALRLAPAPFAAGDRIAEQGHEAHWLYIIVDGQADVFVEAEGRRRVATLGPGSFFGEWSLFMGEPRHATVIARTPVMAYRLDKEALGEVLRDRPALARQISGILAQQRIELDNLDLDDENREHRYRTTHLNILSRLRHLFGLRQEAEDHLTAELQ